MRNSKVSRFSIAAFLFAVAMGGCNDPDRTAPGPGSPLSAPTVVSVVPVGAASGVCQGAVITVTFSKAMNPATINTSTYTVSAGAANITGAVAIDATETIATFTPANPLTVGTTYTVMVSTGAQTQFGIALAEPFDSMFATAATPCTSAASIALPIPACGFGVLAGSTVTNTSTVPAPTNVSGDVGVWAGSAIIGFPPGMLTGMLHSADAVAQAAKGQLTTAFNTAAGKPVGTHLPPDIGGETLPPGVYSTVAQPSLGITGNLTLDAQGDSTAVWIFQIASTLTTAGGKVNLINGGLAQNVYWAIGSSATLGTGTTMAGNLMAMQSISLNTGVTLNGRALASVGAVTLISDTVNVPACGP
jgi:hypothetical protein